MSFVHPEFLYLAPLVALPILIHLLNRIRYRRVRWAAIEFLLKSERRAVRRARLRQLILMALRTLLLVGALGSLLQPILGGGPAALLGGSSQVAVLVDASASVPRLDAGG
ncbi:MAG: BatA domain-containing protein [Planctomycetes bacterium]|nr:BatA domain-containing protein [Planctomycetota bacterium]